MNQDNGGIIGKINTSTTTVASGVWTLQDQFEAQSSSTWPLAFPQTTIANSCRFDSASTDRLTRTITGTNTTKFTVSMWVKLADDGPNILYASETNSSDYIFIQHNSSGNLNVQLQGTQNRRITNRIFRDLSAWYNFVVVFDSTEATASDRIKVYVNGQQETSFSTNTTNMSQNSNLSPLDDTIVFGVGNYPPAESQYMNGYMAEFIAVYGQALTPTSFGATNPVTNIWEPIAYAGTYGTNGFRLDFADSSALGNDVSGNDNDFTVANLTSVDQSTDTCSNNFATLNPLVPTSSATFSEGNLKIVGSSSSAYSNRSQSTFAVESGKWYFEVEVDSFSGSNPTIGIGYSSRAASLNPTGSNAGDICIRLDNEKYDEGSSSSSYFSSSFSNGNIVGVALDMDNGKVWFSKDGTFVGTVGSSGEAATFTVGNGITITPTLRPMDGTLICNFGSPPYTISSGNADANGHGNFEYAVPSGYFALNTKNLAEFG